MSLHSGERQVAENFSGIRKDHLNRYDFAAGTIESSVDESDHRNIKVLDAGCGCGYGSQMLALSGFSVSGIDIDPETIKFAMDNWCNPPTLFVCADLTDLDGNELSGFDAATCFEVIEHLSDPKPFLKKLSKLTKKLFASVPNEDGFKFTGQQFHKRHYTGSELNDLLTECGWKITETWGQMGIESAVEYLTPNDLLKCRTLVVVAEPA